MSSKEAPVGRTNYVDGLDSMSRERYDKKLQLINGVDPYKIHVNDTTCEADYFPDIAYPDIVNYLVHSQSAYTLQDLKAYKSLESYNQFVCGWVKDVRHKEVNSRSVITARVQHSQRLNATPLKPWIITEKDGTVLAGHCDCMAGLGEVCSHVGAVLFYVDALVKLRNSKTVTQEPAYWMLPSGIKKVDYAMVRDINFKSAKSLRQDLNNNIEVGTTPRRQMSTQKLPCVAPPSDSEISEFYRKLHNSKGKPVILSLTPEYASCYVPSCLSESYPMILSELYDESLTNMPKEELLDLCENIFDKVTVSTTQCQRVELETKSQARSKAWFNFRLGRITASRMKAVCTTSILQPSASLIKAICYPHTQGFSTDATRWGCQHESTALAQYVGKMGPQHDDHKCEPCGLIISSTLPYIGASPDSFVSCKCCGDGVIEIKCPYCVRHKDLASSLDAGKSCLELAEGQLSLKRNHPYYYQVQTQLHISGREYCDFIVWTEKDLHIERIEPDHSLWEDTVVKAERFFKRAILPELVAKFYSKPKALQPPVNENVSTCSNVAAPDSQIICICQQPYDEENDDVIGCDNENCKYQWFHFKCIKLKRVPKGTWYCKECKKSSQFAKQK